MLAKKRRQKKAAIRRKNRLERRRAKQFKVGLSEVNKKAIKTALPFVAVFAALWLLITEGGSRRKTEAMIKSFRN